MAWPLQVPASDFRRANASVAFTGSAARALTVMLTRKMAKIVAAAVPPRAGRP